MSAPRLRTSVHLPLRNAAAETIVAALRSPSGLAELRELRSRIAGGDVDLPAIAGATAIDRTVTLARIDAALAAAVAAADARSARALAAALQDGARLFKAGLFFEVHEVLEDAWAELAGDDRTLVQGLIQIAVGLHHLAHENVRGARTLLAEGRAKVAPYVPRRRGVDLASLLATMTPWEDAAAAGRWPEGRALPTFQVDVDE